MPSLFGPLPVRLTLFFFFGCQPIAFLTRAGQPPSDRVESVSSADGMSAEIDRQLRLRWQSDGITPAAVSSDEAFVRRVYLDLAGRIPTLGERQAFIDDHREQKRGELIDRLLGGEDHVQHLSDTFDTLLMGRGNRQRYRQRSEHQWRDWLEQAFRANRPWNQMTAEILLARPQSEAERGVVWYLYERDDDHQAIAESVARSFFGIRIDCAQCHDHMIADEIEQGHYWGLVAFFNRGKNEQTPLGPRVAESAVGGFSEFADLTGSSSPNRLTFYGAETIDEPRPDPDAEPEDRDDLYFAGPGDGEPRVPKFSRRERFVSQIVADHPLIARSFVNRVWAMLMGRGIVHPFDQMDSAHQPSHPELLDTLADDFCANGYDVRRLIRGIANSQAYQLGSQRPPGADDPASFAWYLPRPLTAEQFTRSLQVGFRDRVENGHPLVAQVREKIPAVMPETVMTGVAETLFLTNNPALNRYLEESQGETDLLTRLREQRSIDATIETLCLTLLGREPSADETAALAEFLAAEPAESADSIAGERLRHAAWALVTSAEFRFNH